MMNPNATTPTLPHPMYQGTVRLLSAAGLPTGDLCERHLDHFFCVGSTEQPEAVVGIELVGGGYALLRSLAVAPHRRGEGLGRLLLERAESHARAHGVEVIFLLTITAEHFFQRRGYSKADRLTAPAAIRATREFAELCPASSTFMLRKL